MKALAPEHRVDLQRSGLSEKTLELLQFEAVRPADLKIHGATSAYKIPYFTLDGKRNCFERWRLFPDILHSDGSTQKYHQASNTAPQLYLPPLVAWTSVAKDAGCNVSLVEGEKKSAAACERGLRAAGVAGVWNWRQRADTGERLVIPTIDQFIWKDRTVELVPDSDVWRPDKQQALSGFYALAQELISRGASVSLVKLPEQGTRKVGLDDWLVEVGADWEHQWPHLERLALDDARLAPVAAWWQRWREKQATHEAIKAKDQDEVTLEELASLYTVRASKHQVVLTFDRLQEQRGSIHAEVSITLDRTVVLDAVDVGLKSDASQTKLAQSLLSFSTSIPWKVLLQRTCAMVLKRYRTGEPGITLNKDTPVEPLLYAVNPLVFQRKTTIMYGDGGLGKSTLALLIAMLVALGLSVAGLRTILGRVLYLDYEDTSDVHVRRLQAIQAKHPELREAQVHYQRCVEPLTRIIHPLIRQIQQDRITFVVLDSLLAATGGDSSAEATAKLFAALRTLNVSNLVLGHVPKVQGEGQAHPTVYGSVFNQNFARAVWEVKKEQEVGEEGMILGLFNRKSNLSRLHHPIGLKVTQNPEGTLIHYEPYDLSQAAALAPSLPAPAQIRNFLEDGTPRTAKAIADGTGLKLTTVTSALSRGKGQKWQMLGGAGQDTLWAVMGSK